MSELATRSDWRQPITGYKSNSGGRKGRKQAEKPTLTEQGIDVDEFISENHARIQRLRETTPRNRKPEPTYRKVYETWLEQSKTGHPSERSIAKALGKASPPSTITSRTLYVTDTSPKIRSANGNTC